MHTTTASAIVGDPCTPCAGNGICEMQATRIDSQLAFDVILSTKGSDLTINIPSQMVTILRTCRPDVYNTVINDRKFYFGDTETPFYLDYYICQKLWPEGPWYNRLQLTACDATIEGDGSIVIYIPQVIINGDGSVYGSTGSFDGETIPFGTWQIGVDVYGNLVFKNSSSMVLFGSYGNASINRYSLRTLGAHQASHDLNTNRLISSWNYGVDQDNNLVFSNDTSIITFGFGTSTVIVNGQIIEQEQAQVSLKPGVPDTSMTPLQCPGWEIGADTNGNIYFATQGTTYYFGATGDIYIGTDSVVQTNYPLGSNTQ